MPKTSELNKSLIELQEELTTLRTLSDYISDAKNSAADAIDDSAKALTKIRVLTEEYIKKNQNVLNESSENLKESSDALINKSSDSFANSEALLNKNIEIIQENLNTFIKEQNNASKAIMKDAKTLNKSSKDLASDVEALLKKIDSIDFPSRLDKLDMAVTVLNTGIQNIQGRLDQTETNINKNLDNKINLLENDIRTSAEIRAGELQEKMSNMHNVNIILMVVSMSAILGYVYFVMSGISSEINSVVEAFIN